MKQKNSINTECLFSANAELVGGIVSAVVVLAVGLFMLAFFHFNGGGFFGNPYLLAIEGIVLLAGSCLWMRGEVLTYLARKKMERAAKR